MMDIARFAPRAWPGLLAAFLACLLLSGCGAKLSAKHLKLMPWQDGGSQKLYEKFMHFDFETEPEGDTFQVKGTAYAIKENLPLWADSVSDLSVFAYLCDEHGAVLKSASKRFPAQAITDKGFPFQLDLKPGTQPSGGYFITFGYSAMFGASTPPKAGGQGSGGIYGNYVFFANEQAALTR